MMPFLRSGRCSVYINKILRDEEEEIISERIKYSIDVAESIFFLWKLLDSSRNREEESNFVVIRIKIAQQKKKKASLETVASEQQTAKNLVLDRHRLHGELKSMNV
jgi:hypothetical protein